MSKLYDLIIKNATVIDGTGKDGYVSDVAVKDGKIARIAPKIDGNADIIDAKGLTLSPGWIDSHSHSDRSILTYPNQKEKIEQGITFSIAGQCGSSQAPNRDGERLIGMKEYLEMADQTPQGSSSLMLIGHGSVRKAVLGNEKRDPTPNELEEMKRLLRESMEEGALGMSLGLFYVPGSYAKTDEAIELAKVVKEYDGILAAHIRDEGDFLIEAVKEYLTIIKESGCRAVFSHHKSGYRQNWGKVKESLALIDEAVSEGYEIYVDVYPYCASSTTVMARFVPGIFRKKDGSDPIKLLDDPDTCEKIKNHNIEKFGKDLGWVLFTNPVGHPEYIGMTPNQIAEKMGIDDNYDALFHALRECGGTISACFTTMCEEDVEYVIKHPRSMICTDSANANDMVRYHPRLRASFPRALAKYTRDRKTVSLPEMIRKMTSLPAEVYGIKTKGLIKEGYDADICIFDKDKICDKADYVNCSLKNEGLNYVILGGKVVVTDGVHNGVKAGKLYRRQEF